MAVSPNNESLIALGKFDTNMNRYLRVINQADFTIISVRLSPFF